MNNKREMKPVNLLLPGEAILDSLKFLSFYRPCELVLTDKRVLVSGYTGALGPHFTLLRGKMAAGFALTEFESFIIGTGKRPLLLLSTLCLAVAGGVMASWGFSRYPGLVVLALSLFSFMAWSAWPRTFITLSSKGIKISGNAGLCEASVFLERLQLAAIAVKEGKPPEEVRAFVALSGKAPAGESWPKKGKEELFPDEAPACDPQTSSE